MNIELDEATRTAVAALAQRVRERDASEQQLDADLFALSIVTDMRGQGWRPTPAKRVLAVAQRIGPPPHPETAHRGADLVRAALRGEEIP